ncbi:MAG: hypothetical protein WCG98_01550 [bacterium]
MERSATRQIQVMTVSQFLLSEFDPFLLGSISHFTGCNEKSLFSKIMASEIIEPLVEIIFIEPTAKDRIFHF